eukprot:Em0020g716a
MTSGETVSSGCKTQSRDKAFDADRDFAPSKDFQPSTKLPTIKSVIGTLRYHLEREEEGGEAFSVGRMRYGESGKEESKAVKEYKELFTKQNELFDVYAEDPEIRKKLEKEWEEVSTAVIEVGNGMFGRKWKNPEGSEESFDIDTLPNIRNIRIALQQIETQSLSLVVDMLMMEKEKGRMDRLSLPSPLPILSIHGETTENIAMQVDMGMEMVAAVRGVKVEEIYNSAMNKVVRMLEADMKISQILIELDIMMLEGGIPMRNHREGTGATHTKLRDFYKGLHISLGKPVSEQYTRFTKPEFSGVSEELFQGVKNNYKPEVLNSVSEMANEYTEDVVKLTNLMLSHLQQVLARQRRDYGIDEESFPQQYPVEEEASNIDDTPVSRPRPTLQGGPLRSRRWLRDRRERG